MFRRADALVNRFQFVADHCGRYGVKRLCRVLAIARSSFYHWQAAAAARAAHAADDARLAKRIRAVHTASDCLRARNSVLAMILWSVGSRGSGVEQDSLAQ